MSRRHPLPQTLAFACALASLAGAAGCGGAALEDPGVALTVYSSPSTAQNTNPSTDGFAVVREVRDASLSGGRARLEIADVAARIEASTVSMTSLSHPETRVLEQDYVYDLATPDAVLARYLDEELALEVAEGELGDPDAPTRIVRGRLLAAEPAKLVLASADGPITIENLWRVRRIELPALPDGLRTRPTLVWTLSTPEGDTHRIELAYRTRGIGWSADYVARLDPEASTIDLSAWVTLTNNSGASYADARLKLVAGDVQVLDEFAFDAFEDEDGRPMAKAELSSLEEATGFTEESFYEYHLYTLGRTTTLPDRSTKQIELFQPVDDVPVVQKLRWVPLDPNGWWNYGSPVTWQQSVQSRNHVDVWVEAVNDEDSGLGMPLPGGRVRVTAEIGDDALPVGTAWIEHTPRNEKLELRVATAFDVTGRRVEEHFDYPGGNEMSETVRLTLHNGGDTARTVEIDERLWRGAGWTLESEDAHEKLDANHARFTVEVPAGGEREVVYTARYRW